MRRFLFALTSVALVIGACAEGDSDPASTMSAYVAAYNSDDIMVFFSEDSAITGHPYPVEARGLDGIRELHIADRQAAAVEDPYTISNLGS